ncbi:hypothetical protein HYC85_014137 [Camellia sinensis]|uniref:Uncharacterized protein n=1 Tax=Camellia sinensis TaxID=4442 RepID=A0A7J7H5E9_CAMSI|nr:hypothetical protein HYC85_014137 [Camellia sinensis]
MGFFLVRDISFPRILNESEYTEGFCVLSSQFVKLIFRLDKLAGGLTYNGSVAIEEPDKYNLIFGNCQPEFEVTMNVHTEMYNVRNDGTKDFLPAGQTLMPKLYFLLFLVYTIFLGTWIFICIKQRSTVDRIHLIMCALLLFKALKLICASEDKMYITKTGTPHGWDVAFYVFGFFKGVILFTVIVLIGTGWSFLKPYLQEREKKVLMFYIVVILFLYFTRVMVPAIGTVVSYRYEWVASRSGGGWELGFLVLVTMSNCSTIMKVMDEFCNISGLKVNSHKSKLYVSPNIERRKARDLSTKCGIPLTNELRKYWGVP